MRMPYALTAFVVVVIVGGLLAGCIHLWPA